MALTPKQRLFVAAYRGNATEAAKAAGYSQKTAATQGARLFKNVQIRDAIAKREGKVLGAHIKSRTELQEYWSAKVGDDAVAVRDQLRASELLEKSRGGFTQRLEVHGELGILDLVRESMSAEAAVVPPSGDE